MTDIWRAIRTSTDPCWMRRWLDQPEMVDGHTQLEAFRRDQLTREAVEMIYPQEKPRTHWAFNAAIGGVVALALTGVLFVVASI